jgi:hypothetical protein
MPTQIVNGAGASVIRKLPNSLCPTRKNPWQDTCKWNLLKVREGNTKGSHGRCRWTLQAEKVYFFFPGAFQNLN